MLSFSRFTNINRININSTVRDSSYDRSYDPATFGIVCKTKTQISTDHTRSKRIHSSEEASAIFTKQADFLLQVSLL